MKPVEQIPSVALGIRDRGAPAVRVVFVCKGNICRSPVAEAFATDASMAWPTFESAATHDYHVGRGAHPLMIEVARDWGIDLAEHRVRQFDRLMVDGPTLVVAMDSQVLASLTRDFGISHARLLRAGAEIIDPYSLPRSAFERCVVQIREEVQIFLALLRSARGEQDDLGIECDERRQPTVRSSPDRAQ